ncbi:MAG: DotG/IcmE/VirB10 family protein [Gemmatimonadetes bacterium]|nr:DotG/IcmE/VirB10 family protein [Gemmatimonadota bacterium]
MLLAVLGATAGNAEAPDNRDVKLNPAGGAGTSVYRQTLEERNLQGLEESMETGDSHVDVVTPAAGGEEGDAVEPPEVGARAKIETEEADRKQPETVSPETGVQPVRRVRVQEDPEPGGKFDVEVGNVDAFVAALVEALDRAPNVRRITYASREEGAPSSPEAGAGRAALAALPEVGAGDAFYARLLHAVNSDYPGPVLIEILQPPLAGAVARGEFQLVRDRMVIRLSSLETGGEALSVDAVAVGLDCACFGVSGDVSYHWWERVLLPAATGFVEQYLIARAEPEQRVVTGAGGTVASERRSRSARQARDAGLAAAAGRVGEVLREQSPSVRTVSIPRNAELAVMFAETLQRRRVRPVETAETPRRPEPPAVERVRAPAASDGGVR